MTIQSGNWAISSEFKCSSSKHAPIKINVGIGSTWISYTTESDLKTDRIEGPLVTESFKLLFRQKEDSKNYTKLIKTDFKKSKPSLPDTNTFRERIRHTQRDGARTLVLNEKNRIAWIQNHELKELELSGVEMAAFYQNVIFVARKHEVIVRSFDRKDEKIEYTFEGGVAKHILPTSDSRFIIVLEKACFVIAKNKKGDWEDSPVCAIEEEITCVEEEANRIYLGTKNGLVRAYEAHENEYKELFVYEHKREQKNAFFEKWNQLKGPKAITAIRVIQQNPKELVLSLGLRSSFQVKILREFN